MPSRSANFARGIVKEVFAAWLVSSALSPTGFAAGPGLSAPIRQFIDGINSGDTKSANAAYATGDILIVDEVAPHRFSGPNAPQDWLDDFGRFAAAAGITDTHLKDSAPTRAEIEGEVAYVVVPTLYTYKEKGKAMKEEGQLTLVLHSEAGVWKISAWTWTGVKPHPAK
jgi:hypothetical protein